MVVQAAGDGMLLLAALIQMKALDGMAWGLCGLLLSTLETVRVITDAGLHVVGIRLLAIGGHPPGVVLRHVQAIKSVLALVGFLVIAGLAAWLPAFSGHATLMVGLGLTLFPFAYAAGLVLRFQAEHRMAQLIVPKAAAGALFLGAVWVGVREHWGVTGYIGAYVAYQFLVWFATSTAFRRTWPADVAPAAPTRPDWHLAGLIARQASPVGLLMIIVIAYSRLGVFFLERVASLAAVGQYYAALKVTEPLLALAGALSVSAFPVLSRLVATRDMQGARVRFARYSIRSAALSCGVAAVLTLVGRPLLGWIRPEYVAASGALTALAWATVFMFQNQLSTAMINAFGKFHLVTAISAINLIVFLVLSYLLLPRYGATGAGLSLLGTEAGNALMQLATVFVLLGNAPSARQSRERATQSA